MAKFNTTNSSRTVNAAGGRAFSHSPEMELITACLGTFLKDTFYESGDSRINRIAELVKKVKPEFVAKLAIVARKQFYLRSVSHVLVGELSKVHRGDSLVKRTIIQVAERPDDLTEIVSYCGKPLPNQIKKGVAEALKNFNAYKMAKYKSSSKKTKLVDLLNLVHPKPENKEQKDLFESLIKGELKCEDTWEARLSSGEDKGKVWSDMIGKKKIGYMALLRNLRNISAQANKTTIAKACKIISDPEEVKKSKQLPFRFYNAYENVSNQDMLESVAKALEISLDNVPKFEGKTLIAVDTSGSMSGDPIKKSSVFAAALMKSNQSDVILYDTQIAEMKYLKGVPMITLAESIQSRAMGGGTQTSLVFDYAFSKQEKYNRIIILSDNESWNEWSVQDVYNKYRKINDCFVYAIDIQGNGTKDITSPRVRHLCGWSEKMFDYMKWSEKENSLIDFINKTKI